MSKEVNMNNLALVKASRVVVREHINNALIVLSQLEEITDKFNPSLHENVNAINANVEALRQYLEEDFNYNEKVIDELETYQICNDCNNMELLRKELDKKLTRY